MPVNLKDKNLKSMVGIPRPRPRPTKQSEFCNYLLDKFLITQAFQSGLIGQGGPGGPFGPFGPGGPGGQVGQVAQVVKLFKVV